MSAKSRILIVDDQKLFVDNLKSVFEFRAPDFEVVGIGKNGLEAIELARSRRPDLVLMDIRMPEVDGVEATRTIHAEFPDTCIIVLTTFDDDECIIDALEAGAKGYLLKDIPFNELLVSLRAAREGTFSISPGVIGKLMRRGREVAAESARKEGPVPSRPPWLDDLGRREREVLLLIAKGYDNARIASELFIGEQTAKNYVCGIYGKIGEHSRLRAMEIAKDAERWLKGGHRED